MNSGGTTSGIARYLTAGSRAHPDRNALEVWGGGARTYGQLESRANRLAQALLGAGLRPGSRIAVWLDNCLEYLDVYLAAAKAGFVVVPVNIRYTATEAGEILDAADVQALVFCAEVEYAAETLTTGAGLSLLVGVGAKVAGSIDVEDLVATGHDQAPPPPAPDDPLVIGYTSGTTGRAKGAVLTHRSMEHVGLTNALVCRYRMRSVQVFGMSLSFTATVPAHVLPHLFVGGTTVLHRGWDSQALADSIGRRGGDFLIVPSPALREIAELLAADPVAADRLGSVLHSASKADPADLGALVEVLGDRVVEGWGMTENSGGLFTASQPGDLRPDDRASLLTSGRAVPGAEVEVIDEDGAVLSEGTGLLRARAESLFQGYWGDPEASAACLSDGWFLTGDLGSIGSDGVVSLVDRRADLINSGGMNVYPSEVERVLMDSGLLREAVVVPASHPRWGQVPVAFVVPAGPLAERELEAWVADRLAGYKRPTRIRTLASLPRNANGKVLRRALSELAGKGD